MCDIANLIDDSEIKIYPQKIIKEKDEENYNNTNINNKTTSSFYKGKYIVKTNKIFYFYRETIDDKMKVLNGNRFIVLKGSKIDSNIYS